MDAATQEFEGPLIEHGLYNVRELDEQVILFAQSLGFDGIMDVESDDEEVSFIADDAIAYLQSFVPRGFWVGHDGDAGAFGVWRVEDEG